jgi:hypothetical protein
MGAETPTPGGEKLSRDIAKRESLSGITIKEARELVEIDPYLSNDTHTQNFLDNDGSVIVDGVEKQIDIGRFLSGRHQFLVRESASVHLDHLKTLDREAYRAAVESSNVVINGRERVVVQGELFDTDSIK